MAKITITLDDTLQDCVDGAIADTKQTLLDYLEENPDLDDAPCLSNDLDYDGRIHEIVDSAVPIYTQEIKTAWYLHGDELEEAYENAGIGENPRDNNGMAAIYFYISDKVAEWYYDYAEEIFSEWYEERRANAAADDDDD